MKNRIITILFLFNLSLLFIGCYYPDRWNGDMYKMQTSAAVGDTVEVVFIGGDDSECDPDIYYSAHDSFGGLSGLFSLTSIYVSANQFDRRKCTFTVPPKAVSSNYFFDKDLFIEYPKTLTCTKKGNEVTVKSEEQPFFNIEYFSQEKAQLLLENDYPFVWLDGEAPTKAKSHVLENWSPLEGKDNYVLESITPYQVTFTIPGWFKGGNIHILNENGYAEGYLALRDAKITEEHFNDILLKINTNENGAFFDGDETFLNKKYHKEEGFYFLNEDAINSRDDYQNIKRILRQADYLDKYILCIEPDPDDPHAFFSSKEKLTID